MSRKRSWKNEKRSLIEGVLWILFGIPVALAAMIAPFLRKE